MIRHYGRQAIQLWQICWQPKKKTLFRQVSIGSGIYMCDQCSFLAISVVELMPLPLYCWSPLRELKWGMRSTVSPRVQKILAPTQILGTILRIYMLFSSMYSYIYRPCGYNIYGYLCAFFLLHIEASIMLFVFFSNLLFLNTLANLIAGVGYWIIKKYLFFYFLWICWLDLFLRGF